MVGSHANICAHCAAEIEAGQRWVREKVYEPALAGRQPRYRHYLLNPSTDKNCAVGRGIYHKQTELDSPLSPRTKKIRIATYLAARCFGVLGFEGRHS